MIRELLRRIRSNRNPPKQTDNATARQVAHLAPKCLVCGMSTAGHRFAILAMTVLSKETLPHCTVLYDHVKNREWGQVRKFYDFKVDEDALIVFAIKGSHPKGMVILINNPHECFARVEMFPEQVVSEEELGEISRLIPESEWQEL